MTIETQTTNDTTQSAGTTKLSAACKVIVDLASQSQSKAVFYKDAFHHTAELFGSPYAEIYISMPSEIVEDYWHTGSTSPTFWKPTVHSFLTESLDEKRKMSKLYASKGAKKQISFCLLSCPMYNPNGATIGSVAMVVRCKNSNSPQQYGMILETLVSLISYSASLVGKPESKAETGIDSALGHLSKTAKYNSHTELSFAITNNLRNKMGCDLVALGVCNRQKVKVVAISGHDDVQSRSPNVRIIRDAMEECFDIDGPIVYQKSDSSTDIKNHDFRLHRHWHEACSMNAVASVPLHTESEVTAILSLKRERSRPFTNQELEDITSLVEPYAAAFELIDKANRPLVSHTVDSIIDSACNMVKPKRWMKKVIIVCVSLAAMWFLFGTMNYTIMAPGTVVPHQVRHIGAPVDGILTSVNVVEGDYVNKGDVLCQFNHETLLMERAGLLAQLEIAGIEYQSAAAIRSNINAKLASASKKLIEAKLAIINQKIEQSVILAPFDGLVVSGDLRGHVGEVFMHGQGLYDLAASKKHLLRLRIPEKLAGDLKTGLAGTFATYAKPEITHEFALSRVSPRAEVHDLENVYITEAEVDMDESWIKTGMEGVARIEVDRRRVWWVVLHKAIDYIRLNIWL